MADTKKAQSEALPLSLTREELAKLELSFGFYSAKMGAGVQEIHILGNGSVRLKRTRSHDADPEVREGTLEPEALLRLLQTVEHLGLMTLEDEYPTDERPIARRILRLTSPKVNKQVLADEPMAPPEFERLAGALLLAAAQATPEALGNRFFPNL